MAAGLPLIKNVLTPLAKSVFIPLGLTAVAPATDAAIQKKIHGSCINEEMEDIMEIDKLLVKGVSETIKNETKEQKRGFLPV